MKVLVIGFTTEKGQKVSEFLVNRGAVVSVADNRVGQKVREIEGIFRVFTLNPKHRDSTWLMFEISKPDALVYCGGDVDYSSFRNAILVATKNKVSKIVLVVNEEFDNGIKTLAELETQTMIHALRIVAEENKIDWLVIHPSDNLLKEVKRFLLQEPEGEIL